MATLARAGRITVDAVDQEIKRLKIKWPAMGADAGATSRTDFAKELLSQDRLSEIDPFDLVQLEYVLRTCRESRTLSEAGRSLFAVSRQKRSQANDADRLRKYLLRFDLDWDRIMA
jgi:transcriptional regulatory protein RtcR